METLQDLTGFNSHRWGCFVFPLKADRSEWQLKPRSNTSPIPPGKLSYPPTSQMILVNPHGPMLLGMPWRCCWVTISFPSPACPFTSTILSKTPMWCEAGFNLTKRDPCGGIGWNRHATKRLIPGSHPWRHLLDHQVVLDFQSHQSLADSARIPVVKFVSKPHWLYIMIYPP